MSALALSMASLSPSISPLPPAMHDLKRESTSRRDSSSSGAASCVSFVCIVMSVLPYVGGESEEGGPCGPPGGLCRSHGLLTLED